MPSDVDISWRSGREICSSAVHTHDKTCKSVGSLAAPELNEGKESRVTGFAFRSGLLRWP